MTAKLVNATTGETVLEHIEIADAFWQRLKGLQFRRSLPKSTGLLLSPCSSLHTCFMRFPIDVVMLDEEQTVLGVFRSLKPWRILVCHRATHSAIEVNPAETQLSVGDRVRIV